MRWTRKSIVAEIKELHSRGVELNYATAEAENLNLVRAAAWHFGTWRRAVEAAGIAYESICKYRRWNRERIVARIRELNDEKADLSWRSISTEIDPPLAAAALRPNGFRTWREAIAAAGLNIDEVARYQCWTEDRVLREIKALKRDKAALSSKAVQSANQPLFCAARRRFGSWDEALAQAGFSAARIRLRRPSGQTENKALKAAVASMTRNPSAGRAAVKASDKNGGIKTAAPKASAGAKVLAAAKAAPKPTRTAVARTAAAAARGAANTKAGRAVRAKTQAVKVSTAKAAAPKAAAKTTARKRAGAAQLSFDLAVPASAKKGAAKAKAVKAPAKKAPVKAAPAKATPAKRTAAPKGRAIAARPVAAKAASKAVPKAAPKKAAAKTAVKAAPAKAKASAKKAAAAKAPKQAAARGTRRK